MQRSARMYLCVLMATAGLLGFLAHIAEAAGPCGRSLSAPSVTRNAPRETPSDPVIDVWYGHNQRFGHIGNPQRWINILGKVSDPDGIASLAYSLNGGQFQDLNIGPDGRRLADEGDFNVEIDHTDLSSGSNEVVIMATDTLTNTALMTVAIEYGSGNVWPRPYSIDWSSVGDIQDVLQVVDGLWTIEGEHIRPVGADKYSYDRLVAMGDISWLDYEVSVPITIHQFYGIDEGKDPGVGILVRWNGHGDDSEQPHYAHPFGGLGWFRYPYSTPGRLAILGNENYLIAEDDSGRQLELEVPHIFKIRVETRPDGRGYYSFKVWEEGDAEPLTWELSNFGKNAYEYEKHGSVLLVAHRTDASFGDVTVTPPLALNVVGEGTVAMDPDQASHHYGDEVTLTASANPGWRFIEWSGDLTGTDNPSSITLDNSKAVTATFAPNECVLRVDTVGEGTVAKEPDQAVYQWDDVVTLRADPDPGWYFVAWSADLQSADNPETITMDGNKAVTCTFGSHRMYFPLAGHSG